MAWVADYFPVMQEALGSNPSSQRLKQEDPRFKVIFSCMVSPGPACAMTLSQDPIPDGKLQLAGRSMLSVSCCPFTFTIPSGRGHNSDGQCSSSPRTVENIVLPGDRVRAEGRAAGSSDPRKDLGLQGCDPVSQTHLGENHQEGHPGPKDRIQKHGVREEPQAIHRHCQNLLWR